ncbi:MAG: hypothetical protein ACE5KV_02590, partial [Thermoplasmata archaeon]
MIGVIDLLKRVKEIIKSRTFLELILLLILNIAFASLYLFSSSERMIGFPIHQDGYLHMIVIDHISGLVDEGSIPFGMTWFDLTRNGVPRNTFI